jgi:hypothetical protein
MKLCKDCKYYRGVEGANYVHIDKCERNVTRHIAPDYVRGVDTEYETGRLYCMDERLGFGDDFCGIEGKYWEPKP